MSNGEKVAPLKIIQQQASTIVALKNEVANLQAWLADRDSALHAEPASQHAARDYLDFDSKLRLLQGAATMTCNMLERDNKVVRTEAAELLRVAVAEFTEVASQPVPRAGRNTSNNSAENPAAIRALASQPAAPVQPKHPTLDWMAQEAKAHLDGLDADMALAAPPVQQPGDVRDLIAEITSIPCETHAGWGQIAVNRYKSGHRDALNAAALLVGQAIATTRPSAALTEDRILALSDESGVTFENSDGGRESPYAEGYDTTENVIAFARAILAASSGAVAVPEWISVDDELPDVETDVLVFGKRGDSMCHAVAGLFNGEWLAQDSECELRFIVSHWCELRAAPATPAQGQTT